MKTHAPLLSLEKKFFFLLIYLFISNVAIRAQTSENVTITSLFQNSYKVYKDIRKPNGIYLDALALNGVGDKPAAIVANGIGLISLCIADAMYQKTGDGVHWEPNASILVNETLQTFIDFKNAGKTNSAGLFYRYFNYNTGDQEWSSEYSTIDNAIFALGLYFCKNYFASNAAIVSKANILLNAMDYTKAIDTNQIYMILDQNGNGNTPTIPYNEYMLVAWLAKNSPTNSANYGMSQTFWNNYFANPTTAPVSYVNYWGYETLSDGQYWLPSFIPQFCYYLCNYYKNNTAYMAYFANSKNSDKLYCQNTGFNSYEWGLGAGDIPGGGYSADAVENNPNKIVSPHIIAGFIPVSSQSKSDLLSLYNNGTGSAVYSLVSDPSKKVLWRYRQNNTNLRASYIQAIDFSTMLFGVSSLPEYLGENWFNMYNIVNTGQTLNVDRFNTKKDGSITYNRSEKIIRVSNIPGEKHIKVYSMDGRNIVELSSTKQNVFIDTNFLGFSTVLVSVSTPKETFNKRIIIY